LHGDRRIAANLDLADLDLPSFAPFNHEDTIKDRHRLVNQQWVKGKESEVRSKG
jgi:hypothetical protein